MRDAILFMVVFGGLPFAFTRPYFGLVMFSWLAYMRPQDLCWGPARGIRFSLFVALCMFTGFAVCEKKRPFTRWVPQTKWILLLGLWVYLSIVINGARRASFQYGNLIDLYKVFAVSFFTIGLVDSKRRLDLLTWTIGLGLGFYGFKGGIFGLMGGRILQGPGGMLKDNNDLCMALNMVLPMVFYMGMMHSHNRRIKRLCYLGTALIAIAIVITKSRGGILTLGVVLFLLVLRSRKKFIGFSAGAVGISLFLLFLPADVKERLKTLEDPTQESSAAGRLFAWGVAYRMFEANPFFGIGFENFIMEFTRYAPSFTQMSKSGVDSIRVTHNSYLQVLSETGGPALLWFLMVNISTLLMVRKMRKLNKRQRGPPWIYYYCTMIEVSLLAFMSGAMFLNRSHFDLFYHVVALGAVVNILGRRHLRGELVADDEFNKGKAPQLRFVPDRSEVGKPVSAYPS